MFVPIAKWGMYIYEGIEGMKKLLRKGFDPRIGKIWYIPIILLWSVIAGFSFLVASFSEGASPEIAILFQL